MASLFKKKTVDGKFVLCEKLANLFLARVLIHHWVNSTRAIPFQRKLVPPVLARAESPVTLRAEG